MKKLLAVIACTAAALAGTWAPGIPAAGGARVYVCSQNSAKVFIIDSRSNEVLDTVDLTALGFSKKAKPHHVAVEPDGSFWYVTLIGENKVLKFTRDNKLAGQASFMGPGMLALNPTNGELYVARSMSAVNPPPRIGIINRSDMSIEEVDVFFPRPHALVVDGEGRYVYVASVAENRMGVLDTETGDYKVIDLPGDPLALVQFAIAPDGKHMVATAQLTSELLVFDLADRRAPKLTTRVRVDKAPWHPAYDPSGKFVYFGSKDANTVTTVDATDWTVAAVTNGDGLAEPHGSGVSPDGRWIYVSNRNLKGEYHSAAGDGKDGTLVVIDSRDHSIAKVIELGGYGSGIGVGPGR